MALRIGDFQTLSTAQRGEAARVLREALAHMDSAFNGAGEAEEEVATFRTDPDRFALAALDGDALIGWIGGIRTYDQAWELHPLVVDPARQRQGVGRALVGALEARMRVEGVLTIYLGTDDDFGGTSLFGRDVFPDVLAKLRDIAPAKGHPYAFYQKLGYEVVGLIPDANGFGKPDILMAKRLS